MNESIVEGIFFYLLDSLISRSSLYSRQSPSLKIRLFTSTSLILGLNGWGQ